MLSVATWVLIGVAVLYPIALVCLSIESRATLKQWFWALVLFGLVILAALLPALLSEDRH
jgi:hypothetical protein